MSGGADVDVHLSIGEVLALLQEEFPDCTISKIRFLESQGLIQPDRTASGYRKFYEADIDRLRWILRQQRDHFLPLKVIRKMLDEGVDRYDPGGGDQPTLFTPNDLVVGDGDEDDTDPDAQAGAGGGADRSPRHPAVASAPARPTTGAAPSADGRPAAPAKDRSPASADPAAASSRPAPSAPPAPRSANAGTPAPGAPAPNGTPSAGGTEPSSGTGRSTAEAAPEGSGAGGGRRRGQAAATSEGQGRQGRSHETPADVVAALQEDPRRKGSARSERDEAPPVTARRTPLPPRGEETMEDLSTAEELCEAAGIDGDLLAGLERYGLVVGQPRGGEVVYGRDAHAVCALAARYAEHGIEPRHLRMYLVAAEREAGFVEQLAVPLLKQRNPAARDQARSLARELEGMGVELHALLLRRELGPDLGG